MGIQNEIQAVCLAIHGKYYEELFFAKIKRNLLAIVLRNLSIIFHFFKAGRAKHQI
jgi:hypothetical protein